MRKLALQDFLTRSIERVAVRDQEVFNTVGILSYGKGLFLRTPIQRGKTKYTHFFRIHESQFVYSKLFAWEGAVAVVPKELDGMFVSQEFPVYDIDKSLVLPEYLRLIAQWQSFWAMMRQGESGMGGRRKRVKPERVMELQISVPELKEQRRIVDLVSHLEADIRALERVQRAATRLGRAVRQAHFRGLQPPDTVASEFFEVTIGRQRSPQHAGGDCPTAYLRAANVKPGKLELSDVKSMNFDSLERLKFSLRPGDALVTEGCGSRSQIGAPAQWNAELDQPVCFQNTLLRLRGRPDLSDSSYAFQWAMYCFEEGIFADMAAGTNIFHLGSEKVGRLPVFNLSLEGQRVFLDIVEGVDRQAARALRAKTQLTRMLDALRSDVLSGQVVIPARYDVAVRGANLRVKSHQ